MELLDLIKEFSGYGIFAGLFIWHYTKSMQDSKERENKLYEQLDKYNDQLKHNTEVLQAINTDIKEIKDELENKS